MSAKKKPIYHIINGKRYKVEFLPSSAFEKKIDGTCDGPHIKNKAIKIRKGMSEEDTLETIIHEFFHGTAWELWDEVWVEKVSKDLTRLLIRLGYKRDAET